LVYDQQDLEAKYSLSSDVWFDKEWDEWMAVGTRKKMDARP